jgi:voltage-gated potassium channel Kch
VVLDHDAEQIDALRKFGYKVFYGDATRTDLLEAAGAHTASAIVIAIDDREKILELAGIVKQHFPHLRIFARAFDRYHAYQLINQGVKDVYREVFESSVALTEDLMVALGKHPYEARRAAAYFSAYDKKILAETAPHMDDDAALVDIARASRAHITSVLAEDRNERPLDTDHAWEAPDRSQA